MQHFSSLLFLFFIICCLGVKSNSLTSTIQTSDLSDGLIDIPNDEFNSTVLLDDEQTNTTTVHESNDLRPSTTLSSTIKIAAGSESPTPITSANHSHVRASSPSKPPTSTTVSPSIPSHTTSTSPFLSPTPSSNSSPSIIPKSPQLSRSGVQFRPSLIRCPEGSQDEYATDSAVSSENGANASCQKATDCLNIGWAKEESLRVDVTCVYRNDLKDSGCCYAKLKDLCSEGTTVLPVTSCETLDDCNLLEGRTTHRWCDPVAKTCCRLDKEQELYCPDQVTPLMNEPRCIDSTDDIWSGKCPNTTYHASGICKYGHCCPSNNTEILPMYSHRTNLDCTNSTVIPASQVNGYCDPKTGKVFMMGKYNDKNQTNKALPYYCRSARDCGQSFGMDNVCVRMKDNHLRCYVNPRIAYFTPQPRSLFVFSMLSYIALGTSLLALVFSILYKTCIIDDSISNEKSATSELSQPLVPSQE